MTTINQNYVPKADSTNPNLANFNQSLIYDDGTSVGINTASPAAELDINGNLKIGNNIYTVNNYTSFNNAVTNLGSNQGTIIVTGNISFPSAPTTPSIAATIDIKFSGQGEITVPTGVALTINKMSDDPLWQVFDTSATNSSVSFGTDAIKHVRPEWWGIDGTNDQVEINFAIAAASPISAKVRLLPGRTYNANGIVMQSNVEFIASGATITNNDSSATDTFTMIGAAAGSPAVSSAITTDNPAISDNSLTVASASAFSSGDYVLIDDGTYAYDNDGPNQELNIISAIDLETNTLTFVNSLIGNYVRRALTFSASGYTNCVPGDIGKPVVGGTTGNTGTLVSYDNTSRIWAVTPDSDSYLFNQSELVSITGGTGQGTTSGPATLAEVVKLAAVVNAKILGGTWNMSPANSGSVIRGDLCYNCQVKDVLIDGFYLGIVFNESAFVDIRDNIVRNASHADSGEGYGIEIGGSSHNFIIQNNTTENIRENLVTNNSRFGDISHNRFLNSSDDGVNTHGSGNSFINIMDNEIIGCSSGIIVGNGVSGHAVDHHIRVIGNMIANCSYNGILVFGTATLINDCVEIRNNTVFNCALAGEEPLIEVEYGTNINCIGNKIYGNKVANIECGIYYDEIAGGEIADNEIKDIPTEGIYVETSSNLSIVNNYGQNITSNNIYVDSSITSSKMINNLFDDDNYYIGSGAGVSILTMASGGNVGIGTTSPGQVLDVSGSINASASVIAPVIKAASTSTTALQLQTPGGISVLNVDTSNQRVGIGTTAPSTALDVWGSNSFPLKVTNDLAVSGPSAGISLLTPNSTNSSDRNWGVITNNSAHGNLELQVSTSSTGSPTNSLLTLQSSGNVGIGTTSPAQALDVAGNIRTSGNIIVSGSAPTHSTGKSGDVAGMITCDSTYLYVCTASYDGTTNIWRRITLPTGTW